MKFVVFISILFLVSCKINRTNKGIPVGKWKYVSGTTSERLVITGKYDRKGREKGVWKYYRNDTLFRSERYFYPYSVDVLFHKNGKVSEIGKSFTSQNKWTKTGTWYYFNEHEKLTDSITFEN